MSSIQERRAQAREERKGKPGRYTLQVFDLNGRRYATHHCDGSYDFLEDAQAAQLEAFSNTDADVGSCLMRDTERFNAPTQPSGE